MARRRERPAGRSEAKQEQKQKQHGGEGGIERMSGCNVGCDQEAADAR
jgi:hypothetical protein